MLFNRKTNCSLFTQIVKKEHSRSQTGNNIKHWRTRPNRWNTLHIYVFYRKTQCTPSVP